MPDAISAHLTDGWAEGQARDVKPDVKQGTSARAVAAGTLAERVARVYELLVQAYGIPPWEPDGDALGGLIATVLSQHTSDVNSARAYARLVEAFPDWEAVRDAPVEQVAEAIRPGGLAGIKAERIQRILRELTQRLGGEKLTLAHLAALSESEATAYLRSLPGVGPKTAACVLLFSLGKNAFPVDTHVHRVAQRLGLVGPKASAEAAQEQLEAAVAPERRHTLHVNLIRLGREICHARNPACPQCPLRSECAYYWSHVAGDGI